MTFATKITVGRMLLVPVFIWLAVAYGQSVDHQVANETLRYWAIAIFVLAAASDGIDGWVARRFNQRSELGAYLDPLADKFLLLSAILVLTIFPWGSEGWRLPWWFTAVVVARDVTILCGIRILQWKRCTIRFGAHWLGKITTVTQMIAVGWVMLKVVPWSPMIPCAIATAFTLASAVVYVAQGKRMLRGV